MSSIEDAAKAGYESFFSGLNWERDAGENVKAEWRMTASRMTADRVSLGQFVYDARSVATVVKRWDENATEEQQRHQSAGEAMLKARQR